MSIISDFRLLMPEEVYLSAEDYLLARQWSNQATREWQNWQSYLNGLGMIAFERWFKERQKKFTCSRNINYLERVAYLEINGFKLCLLAQEDYLEEEIILPKKFIEQPDLAAHFYGILEVVEELETVIIRGISQRQRLTYHERDSHNYRIMLRCFDPELNHFLADCRYLEPTAIPLPQNPAQSTPAAVSETITKLGQWLEGSVTRGWQTLEQLLMPEAQLAFATRNLGGDLQRGKLMDLGVSLGGRRAVLLITLTPAEDNKIRLQVRLCPFNDDYLPANLKLSLKSRSGKVIQSVETRQRDNYIQLKPFKTQVGKTFQLEVSGDEFALSETFEV